MNSAATNSAIACTLSAENFRERLEQNRALAHDSLRSHERQGLVLTLRYDASAAHRVREMLRREQECCAFLSFAVNEAAGQIVVKVTAPEEARVAAETMFEQFVTTSGNSSNIPARVAVVCAGIAATCGPACIAPMVLPSIVLAGAGTLLAWFADAHSWITGLAVVSVAFAWAWIWLQAKKSGQRPNNSTTFIVGVATALVVLAAFWPIVEQHLMRGFGG